MDISAFWQAVLAQNRSALPTYFCGDVVIRWHCTNEQFTVSEYVCPICDYPGNWEGEIERVETKGNLAIAVVRVYPTDRSADFWLDGLTKVL